MPRSCRRRIRNWVRSASSLCSTPAFRPRNWSTASPLTAGGWQVGPTGALTSNYNGQDGASFYRDLAIGPAGTGIDGFEVHYDKALHAYALWNPETRVYIGV